MTINYKDVLLYMVICMWPCILRSVDIRTCKFMTAIDRQIVAVNNQVFIVSRGGNLIF